MKKFTKPIAMMLLGLIGFYNTSCMGSWALLGKVYNWNKEATGNKFIDNLLFWIFLIIPVYAIILFIDFIIFNLIEFWGGSNPIAMKEGEVETQLAWVKGEQYHYEVTKNQYKITQLTGDHEGRVRILRFNPEEKTWYFKGGDDAEKALMTFMGESTFRVHTKKGYTDLDANKFYSKDQLSAKLNAADAMNYALVRP